MDLRQVRYFLEVARAGNFTRAAERLRIAQPALSMAIKRLEEELELTLFNRQGKRVALTAEGEAFLDHAQRLQGELASAQQEMADLRGLAKGEVRMGIPPMLSSYFFPRIIHAFARRYPGVNLSVTGEGGGRIQQMVLQGELDMGVIAGGSVPESLEARHFLREEMVICVPRSHPLAERSHLSLREFGQQPLVFYQEGYIQRERLLEEMKRAGVGSPRIVFETNLYTLVKSLVRDGMGVGTFLRMVLAEESELAAIPFDPPLYLDLLIAWKKGAYLSRANRAFVEFLLEQTAAYGEEQSQGDAPPAG